MAWPQTAPVLSGAEPSAGGRNHHPRPRGLAGGRDPEHLLTAAKVAPQGAWGDLPEVNKGHIGKKTRIQLLSMEKWLDYRSSEVPFRVSGRKGGKARFGGKDSKNRHDSSF